jgi:hypothetical protein
MTFPIPEKTKTTRLRKPFYELSDGAEAFEAATRWMENPELRSKAEAIQKAVDELREYLDQNYQWD